MKKYYILFGLIFFAFISFTFAQNFDLPLTVTDDTHSITLWFGVDPLGTDGYDPGLDTLAPPPPPSGFDARFKLLPNDFFTDIRDNLITEKQFHLYYQPDIGAEPIVLHWNSSHLDTLGTFFMVDDITGTLWGPLDMKSTDSLVVDNALILEKLRILVTPYEWVPAPSNLTAHVFNFPWRVQLDWNDNSNNELGFVIERDKNSTGFVVLDTVGMNITSYLDTTVEAINTYTYRLFAFSAVKISDYSDTSQVVVPVELSSFTATLSETSVNIKWTTASELNNKGFEIERFSSSLGTSWENIAFIKGKGTTTEVSNYQYVDDFKYISVKGILKYRLKQIDLDGTYNYSDAIEIIVDFTPKEYVLYQNYPNPFNPTSTIDFSIKYDGHVDLVIYDILGKEVLTLVNENKTAGHYNVLLDASGLPSGLYIYKLISGEFVSAKKMILLK